jgi:Tol biopolymer transport system component
MTKSLDIEQLIRIPSLFPWNGYALAPDGQTAAVVWDKSGQLQIYLVRGTGKAKPKPITASAESQMSPAFSPDGKYLAFAQDYSGDENYDILVYNLATGQTRNLTPDTPKETINPYLSWSADGQHIAFVSNREGKFATYTLRVDAKNTLRTVKRVTQHEYSDLQADWSRWQAHRRDCAGARSRGRYVLPIGDGAENRRRPDGRLTRGR